MCPSSSSARTIITNVYRHRGLRAALTIPEKWLYRLRILSGDNISLPDFLGIGAVKAGTTWLYRNLRAHPAVYTANEKEIAYFNRHFHEPVFAYAERFADGDGMIKGEVTPGYGQLPLHRIKFIRTLMPRVRLIFIMRNPVERAWSYALFRLTKIRKIPYQHLTDSDFLEHFRSEASRFQGMYRHSLQQWLRVFPEEQLYVGFYDDISARPKDMLREIFEHIGAPPEVDWDRMPYGEVVHKGPDIPMPDRYREFLYAMYEPEIEWLSQRFGGPVSEWLEARPGRDPRPA